MFQESVYTRVTFPRGSFQTSKFKRRLSKIRSIELMKVLNEPKRLRQLLINVFESALDIKNFREKGFPSKPFALINLISQTLSRPMDKFE